MCHEGCKETPITSAPPFPAQETPPEAGESMKRILEAEQLEGMER